MISAAVSLAAERRASSMPAAARAAPDGTDGAGGGTGSNRDSDGTYGTCGTHRTHDTDGHVPRVDSAGLGSYRLRALPRFTVPGGGAGQGSLLAPMPGTVVRIADRGCPGQRR
jgi:hypothetical protein